jgi:hypothetical protein
MRPVGIPLSILPPVPRFAAVDAQGNLDHNMQWFLRESRLARAAKQCISLTSFRQMFTP